MLGVIKNKLDQNKQVEPSSVGILKENTAASDIIGTLMYQCAHFSESPNQKPSQGKFLPRSRKYPIVNQVELATNTKMPMLKLKEVSFGNNLPTKQCSRFGFLFRGKYEKKV